jgi:pimeloyl-ACP methyl ester carboxylesterase
MLVIGGAEDRFAPPMDVVLTGLYYGVREHIIAGAGHMLMFEESGIIAAEIILDWLDQLAEG